MTSRILQPPLSNSRSMCNSLGTSRGKKNRSLVRLDHLLPTFRWSSRRALRAPPVCSSGSATGETAGRDTVFCGCGHLGLGGSLHPRPTWWPIDWKACNSDLRFPSKRDEGAASAPAGASLPGDACQWVFCMKVGKIAGEGCGSFSRQ